MLSYVEVYMVDIPVLRCDLILELGMKVFRFTPGLSDVRCSWTGK